MLNQVLNEFCCGGNTSDYQEEFYVAHHDVFAILTFADVQRGICKVYSDATS